MSIIKAAPVDGETLLNTQKNLMQISGDKPKFKFLFALGLIIVMAVASLSFYQIKNYMSFVHNISQVNEMRSHLLLLKLALKDSEDKHREFLKTKSEQSVSLYNRAQNNASAEWNFLTKLSKTYGLSFAQTSQLQNLISDNLTAMTESMKVASREKIAVEDSEEEAAPQPERTIASERRDYMDDVNKTVDDIDKDLDRRIQEQQASLELVGANVIWVILLGTGLAVGLLMVWGNLYAKERAKFEGLSQMLGSKQSDLVTAQNKAEIADQIKTEFLNNMSHEIRTPLNAIFGLGQLLKKTNMSPDQTFYLDGVLGSSRSLLDLVNGVLDFAKIENHGLDIHLKPFRLADLLKDVKFILQGQAEVKKLELRFQYLDQGNVFVSDPVRLRQVLLNLAGNALKFTEKGFVEIHVKEFAAISDEDTPVPGVTTVATTPAKVRFEIKDTGIGIPQASQDKIFQNFYQTDSSISRKFGGTGLGLAISKAIVKQLEGEIGFTSEHNKGTTFWFELPVTEATAEQVQTLKQVDTAAKQRGTATGFYGIKTLMIEDNPLNQVVLSGFLKNLGCEVSIYNSGPAALQALRPLVNSNQAPLVFVDCQMPEMDGFQVTKLIREMEHNSSPEGALNPVWIIATTAHTSSGYRDKCLKEGMNDFLSKPILQEDLQEILQRALKSVQVTAGLGKPVYLTALPPAPPSTPPNLSAKIDKRRWEKLQQVPAERGSFLQEIAKIFLENFSPKATELVAARDRRDYRSIRDIAHYLKSSCADIGAMEMSEICSNLETWAEDQQSMTQISEGIDRLLKEYEQVAPEIQKAAAAGYNPKVA